MICQSIFGGFYQELQAEALGVNAETIRREEIRRERRYDNGLEETLCNIGLRHNIDTPHKRPISITLEAVGSQRSLAILSHLQLRVERVVLYQNGIFAPHWTINAHTLLYVTGGRGRVQVVRDKGRLVLDQEVQEGQLLVVPQNFVITEKAREEGLEWVAFKTSDNAINTPLAGQASVIRSLLAEVLANSYLISRETARQLKQGRGGESPSLAQLQLQCETQQPKSLSLLRYNLSETSHVLSKINKGDLEAPEEWLYQK
ncbi:Cocosin 1-like protein [Drosera capensis]